MKTTVRTIVTAVACAVLAGPTLADRITFERLHADPPINGPSVRGVKVAPDGARVTYQKAREDNKDILDLSLVTAYFNFVNRIALGLGVEFTPEEMAGYKDD